MLCPILNMTIWAFCRLLLADQVFYKDDLNWMKGIGCYVWDTPEIVRAKKSYELQSDVSNNRETARNLKLDCRVKNIYVLFFYFINNA